MSTLTLGEFQRSCVEIYILDVAHQENPDDDAARLFASLYDHATGRLTVQHEHRDALWERVNEASSSADGEVCDGRADEFSAQSARALSGLAGRILRVKAVPS